MALGKSRSVSLMPCFPLQNLQSVSFTAFPTPAMLVSLVCTPMMKGFSGVLEASSASIAAAPPSLPPSLETLPPSFEAAGAAEYLIDLPLGEYIDVAACRRARTPRFEDVAPVPLLEILDALLGRRIEHAVEGNVDPLIYLKEDLQAQHLVRIVHLSTLHEIGDERTHSDNCGSNVGPARAGETLRHLSCRNRKLRTYHRRIPGKRRDRTKEVRRSRNDWDSE